jgi:GMP synthase (glutamine-hydrolysing)
VRVLFVQHQDDCPPGLVGERFDALGATGEVVPARARRLPDPTAFDLVVPLGSSDSAADESVSYLRREWELLERAVAAQVPVFGICFGAQLLCRVLGGRVRRMPDGPEIGWLPIETAAPDVVASGPWLAWHFDELEPGPDSVEVARSGRACQAFVHGPHVGVQFHPEATVESVRSWAARYGDSLERFDLDPVAVVAESVECAAAARGRADELVDRVLVRAGVLPLAS